VCVGDGGIDVRVAVGGIGVGIEVGTVETEVPHAPNNRRTNAKQVFEK
jgi:hypothetical protein